MNKLILSILAVFSFTLIAPVVTHASNENIFVKDPYEGVATYLNLDNDQLPREYEVSSKARAKGYELANKILPIIWSHPEGQAINKHLIAYIDNKVMDGNLTPASSYMLYTLRNAMQFQLGYLIVTKKNGEWYANVRFRLYNTDPGVYSYPGTEISDTLSYSREYKVHPDALAYVHGCENGYYDVSCDNDTFIGEQVRELSINDWSTFGCDADTYMGFCPTGTGGAYHLIYKDEMIYKFVELYSS